MARVLKNYIRILRPVNLLMVALTQYSIFQLLLLPLFKEYGIAPTLHGGLIHLFVFALLSSIATGFIINDIIDYEIDLINKPDKIFIGDKKISFKSAQIYYWAVTFTGFLVSIFIDIQTDKTNFTLIYPITVAILYFYSKFFKGRALIGNIIVALFSIYVSSILFITEWENISQLVSFSPSQYLIVKNVALAYSLFGFFSTMYREIIKDIEDYEGDKKLGLSTLPIAIGISNAKWVSILMLVCLSANYYNWLTLISYTQHQTLYNVLLTVLMVVPTLLIIVKTILSKRTQEYKTLSKWAKVLMLISIILFIMICVMQ